MDRETTLAHQTVVVRGERIVSVGPTGNTPVPDDAVIIDGTDRYLVPGLDLLKLHEIVGRDRGPTTVGLSLMAYRTRPNRVPALSVDHDLGLREQNASSFPRFSGRPTTPPVASWAVSMPAFTASNPRPSWSLRERHLACSLLGDLLGTRNPFGEGTSLCQFTRRQVASVSCLWGSFSFC